MGACPAAPTRFSHPLPAPLPTLRSSPALPQRTHFTTLDLAQSAQSTANCLRLGYLIAKAENVDRRPKCDIPPSSSGKADKGERMRENREAGKGEEEKGWGGTADKSCPAEQDTLSSPCSATSSRATSSCLPLPPSVLLNPQARKPDSSSASHTHHGPDLLRVLTRLGCMGGAVWGNQHTEWGF